MEIRQEDHHLSRYLMFLYPMKTGPEIGPAAARRSQADRLTVGIDVGFVDLGVEVKHMDPLRSLALENRSNLRFKKRELSCIHRTRAVYRNDYFPDAIPSDPGKVEPTPEMAAVWPHP